MFTITKNQVPLYLEDSELAISIKSNEPFEIPKEFYRQELIINTFDDLLCYIRICNFWMVNKIPKEIYKWIFENKDKIKLECLTDNYLYLYNEIERPNKKSLIFLFARSVAAKNGHFDCLIYAHQNGCHWNSITCSI